jgi:hypothetical protein
MPLRHLGARVASHNTERPIRLSLRHDKRGNHTNLKGLCVSIRVILGVDGSPLNVRLVLLEIRNRRLNDLAWTTGRRPKMKGHDRAHSSLVICTVST